MQQTLKYASDDDRIWLIITVFVIEYPKQLEFPNPNEYELNENNGQQWADRKFCLHESNPSRIR